MATWSELRRPSLVQIHSVSEVGQPGHRVCHTVQQDGTPSLASLLHTHSRSTWLSSYPRRFKRLSTRSGRIGRVWSRRTGYTTGICSQWHRSSTATCGRQGRPRSRSSSCSSTFSDSQARCSSFPADPNSSSSALRSRYITLVMGFANAYLTMNHIPVGELLRSSSFPSSSVRVEVCGGSLTSRNFGLDMCKKMVSIQPLFSTTIITQALSDFERVPGTFPT